MMFSRSQIVLGTLLVAAVSDAGWWWFSPPNPMRYFHPEIVRSLSVTVNDAPFPAAIAADEDVPIKIRFLRPELPSGREYSGMILLCNTGCRYPERGQPAMPLLRVRATGEPRESMMIHKNGAVVDVVPPPRPPNDPEWHYFAYLRPAELPKDINPAKPIDLHLWIYERDTGGGPGGSPKPSVLIYKATFKMVTPKQEVGGPA